MLGRRFLLTLAAYVWLLVLVQCLLLGLVGAGDVVVEENTDDQSVKGKINGHVSELEKCE